MICTSIEEHLFHLKVDDILETLVSIFIYIFPGLFSKEKTQFHRKIGKAQQYFPWISPFHSAVYVVVNNLFQSGDTF